MLLTRFEATHYTIFNLLKARSCKKYPKFCVNRGDKLLCFYTNVAFENIGF